MQKSRKMSPKNGTSFDNIGFYYFERTHPVSPSEQGSIDQDESIEKDDNFFSIHGSRC